MRRLDQLVAISIVSLTLVAAARPAAAGAAADREEKECHARDVAATEADKVQQEDNLKSHPIVLLDAGVTGYMGGGYEGGLSGDPANTMGFGWGLKARGDIPVLQPLWITGKVNTFMGGEFAIGMDVLAGIASHSYGHEYTTAADMAAANAAIGVSGTFTGVCTTERRNWVLAGGAKYMHFSTGNGSFFALQAGIQRHTAHGRGRLYWEIYPMFAPAADAGQFGAQAAMGGAFFNVVHVGIEAGYIADGGWMTASLGAAYDL